MSSCVGEADEEDDDDDEGERGGSLSRTGDFGEPSEEERSDVSVSF